MTILLVLIFGYYVFEIWGFSAEFRDFEFGFRVKV